MYMLCMFFRCKYIYIYICIYKSTTIYIYIYTIHINVYIHRMCLFCWVVSPNSLYACSCLLTCLLACFPSFAYLSACLLKKRAQRTLGEIGKQV